MSLQLGIAKMLCKASGAAYDMRDWYNEIRATYPTANEYSHLTHGATCTVFSNSNSVIVSFRGTHTITDVVADVSVVPVNGIHSGFATWVDTLIPEVDGELQSLLQSGNKHVYLTGHSLGGSMAQIYALHFVRQFRLNPTVYVFSSPACFTRSTALDFERSVTDNWRIYAEEDPFVFALDVIFTHTSRCAEISSEGVVSYTPTYYIRLNVSKHSITVIYDYLSRVDTGAFSFYNPHIT
jgi:hypothetical protein